MECILFFWYILSLNLKPASIYLFATDLKRNWKLFPVISRYLISLCRARSCMCVLACVCVCECEVTWGISLSTQICASSCLSFPLWRPLPHTVCMCVCVCVCVSVYSPCAHGDRLRCEINHSRWLLWNLITLIICTSLPDSPLLSPGKPRLFMAQPLCSLFNCI